MEGYFSAFQRAIRDSPESFLGVVQEHIKKDLRQTNLERRRLVNHNIHLHDAEKQKLRSDSANECTNIFSRVATEMFEINNHQAQNCTFRRNVTLTTTQVTRGVS